MLAVLQNQLNEMVLWKGRDIYVFCHPERSEGPLSCAAQDDNALRLNIFANDLVIIRNTSSMNRLSLADQILRRVTARKLAKTKL